MQLEEAAVARWGSLEELEEEKDKRVARREKKALEKANDMGTFLICWAGSHSKRTPIATAC